MTKGVWKTIALLSLSVCAILGLGVFFGLLAFWSNLRKIAMGAPICWDSKSRSFDSIAAAQMIGRLDLVSFLLTLGGLGLALFAFMGWWLIRREAKDEAREVATEVARQVAQDYYRKEDKTKTNGDTNAVPPHIPDNPLTTPPLNPADVSTKGAVEETGAKDGQSEHRS